MTSVKGFLSRAAASTKLTLPMINKELKSKGIKDKLARGKGYFYFYGDDATNWPESSVAVNDINSYDLAGWVAEYRRLKKEGDPVARNRADEERYGKKWKR